MYKVIKRVLDIFISLILLIILAPLLLIFVVLIKIDSRGPVIFKQKRLGKNGKVFNMYKFRSMIVGAEKQGVYEAKRDPRVTKVGRIIRKLSIDEFPQLINIIKGDMSIIGPRPVLTYHPWEFTKYTDFQKKRFDVRPGVTGWAQINGRKDVEWNKRIELDIYYVENMSFWLDIKIFFKTIYKVLLIKDNYNKEKTVDTSNNKQHLKLMYITNNVEVAKIAQDTGVDWIFIDLEIKGKQERQKGKDTVISKHVISDIEPIRKVLDKSKLLVRINPIDEDSEIEIEEVLSHKPDIIMLPFFKTKKEVELFIKYVDDRAKICLLLETPEAVNCLDELLSLDKIDYIHIGLNDLHLGYDMKFMFELLADGTVDKIISKIKNHNIEYGFGGVARIGDGILPSESILAEHHRLNSSMVILSRTFFNQRSMSNFEIAHETFYKEVEKIRNYEKELEHKPEEFFVDNKKEVKRIVNQIVTDIERK